MYTVFIMKKYNYKKGIPSLIACVAIWGFQPLYWYVCPDIDTVLLMIIRIIWASAFCAAILAFQGKLSELADVFRDRKKLKREIPAAFFLAVDWFVYLWAVNTGKVLEASLGYFILPLVQFTTGALIFKEKLHWQHFVMLGFISIGVVLSTGSFGGVPYVTIILALAFACYAAIKKSLDIDSIVSTSSEILIMLPFAIGYLLISGAGEDLVTELSLAQQLLLVGSGVVTALPMLFYAVSLRNIPLMMCGLFQYFAPSAAILCGRIMGETLTREKLSSFIFIWIGVIMFIIYSFSHKEE